MTVKLMQEHLEVKRLIVERTGMTDMDYCELQYNHGLEFLNRKCIPQLVEVIEKSPIFWGWWKTMWAKRDRWFLEETNEKWVIGSEGGLVKLPRVTRWYDDYHDLDMLVKGECSALMREGLNQAATLILK